MKNLLNLQKNSNLNISVKTIFPLVLFMHSVFPDIINMKFQLPGLGNLWISEILVYVFFIFFFSKRKLIEKKIYKSLVLIFFSFIVFTIAHSVIEDLSFSETIRVWRKLGLHLTILSTLVYCRLYGTKKILLFLYYGFIIYGIKIGYNNYHTGIAAHWAFQGLSASFILLYSLFLSGRTKSSLYKMILILLSIYNILLPFLGMSRSGIIIVFITIILILYFYSKDLMSFLKYFFMFLILIFFSISIYNRLLNEMSRSHLGARSLPALFSMTIESQSTYLPRVLRAQILIDDFLSNKIFGVGFTKSVLDNAMENYRGDAWQAHNYFLAILGGGGIILFIPILNFYFLIFVQIYNKIKKKLDFSSLFSIGLIFSVLVLNVTNANYARIEDAIPLWAILAIGIHGIFIKKSKIKKNEKIRFK